jgi:hypothetical protein
VTLPTPRILPIAAVPSTNVQDGKEGFRDIHEILNAANAHDGNIQDGAEESSNMDEMFDGILLNDPGSSTTEALQGSRNVPTIASGAQAIVAANNSTGVTRPKGSKNKQPRKRRQK